MNDDKRMNHLTLEQLSADNRQTADVNLQKLGGLITLRELSGEQVMKAAKWSLVTVAGTEGVVKSDPTKQKLIQIALAMVEPSLGDTDERRAANIEVISSLGYMDQLLIGAVLDKLSERPLKDDEREFLSGDYTSTEMFEYLVRGPAPDPNSIMEQILKTDDGEMILDVAIRFPGVLDQSIPMSTVRMLHGAIERDRKRLAEEIAFATVKLQVEAQAEISKMVEEGAGG